MRRKARRIVASVVLIFMMVAGGILPQATLALADSSVQISINAPNEVTPDSDFMATVDISQVENFDAGNYDVSFDPTVLRLDNVTSGEINGTEIPVSVWNEIAAGKFTIAQNVPGIPGVSGSGYPAVLHFHVIGSPGQSSNITLSNGTLYIQIRGFEL